MTNVEALKALYHALGGDLDDVANVSTIVGVLNAILAKFDGADDAELNAQGIANITEIIGNITADLTALDVTPTTEAQNIKPTAPIDGYDTVNVNAVTAAIDSNITAGNIKKDVQILGVTGSYEGSSVTFSTSPETLALATNIRNLSADIPSGVTSIGRSAFQDCSGLTDITIPSSVETIGINAFYKCTGLTDITIPSSVTSIGAGTFNGCTNLTTITIHKPEGSISGAPWGAPNTTTVIWDG